MSIVGNSLGSPGERVALLVLGMHRSGTSALTRTLNLLGADLPRNLYPPNKDNPTGYWESTEWIELHDELLTAHGLSYDSPLSLPAAALTPEGLAPFRARLAGILRRDFANSRLFVAKDPRACRLQPLWNAALADAGFTARYIIIVRHPIEVAGSLAVRDDMPQETALLLWMRHILEIERASRGKPRVFVCYEALLADWRSVIDRIATALKIDWPISPAKAQVEIERFLRRDLRHHAANNDNVLDPYTWPSAIYKAILASLDNDLAKTATFDTIRREVTAGAEFLDRFFTAVVNCDREIARLTSETRRMTDINRSHEAELARHRETVSAEIARLRAELSAVTSSWSWRLTRPFRLILTRKLR